MSLWTKLRDDVEGFFSGPVWAFLKPAVTLIESEGGQILIAAAEAGVAAGAAAATGGGSAAMTAALDVFKTQVVANGLPFIESQGRTLIELALQKAKAAIPAAPAAAPIDPAVAAQIAPGA
jgi:hypothetical protein